MILKTPNRNSNTLSICENGTYTAQYNDMTLTSVYQPIFDVNNKKIGLESLVRVFDKDGSNIPANLIFHNSNTSEIDLVNISNLCRMIHIHNFSIARKRNKKNWMLFINLSPICCEDVAVGNVDDFFNKRYLKSMNIKPNKIVIEFVESPYDSNYILGVASRTLKKFGFNVAYDDFLDNDSDYKRLAHIQPEIVKMDMALLNSYMNGNKRPLMRAVKSAKMIGAKTLIEGIEDQASLTEMKKLGFDYYQGYFLGRPEPLTPI